jgi:hypothetical protein
MDPLDTARAHCPLLKKMARMMAAAEQLRPTENI